MILYRFCGSHEQYLLEIKLRGLADFSIILVHVLNIIMLGRNRKITAFVFHFRAIQKYIQLD